MAAGDIIAWIIFAGSLVGMLVMVVRKFPVLAAMDLSRVAAERHAHVKTSLMEERLRRKMVAAQKRFGSRFYPFLTTIQTFFRRLSDRVIELEKRYREKAENGKFAASRLGGHKNTVIDLLGKSETLVNDGNYMEAEKKYIDVITIDPRNFEAYKGLGEVYLQQKDYPHARAALSHALKLKNDEPEVHADVALAFQELGRVNLALKSIEKALELGGNNPKYLDIQIELAIAAGDKILAESALKTLREVNPDNQKINEFEEQILQLKIQRK